MAVSYLQEYLTTTLKDRIHNTMIGTSALVALLAVFFIGSLFLCRSVGTRFIASASERDSHGADAIHRVPTGRYNDGNPHGADAIHRVPTRICKDTESRPGKVAKWGAIGLLCMMILSACSNGSTSTPTPTITPLALTATATAQHGATATPTPANNTDWPTYHRDNQRTGY